MATTSAERQAKYRESRRQGKAEDLGGKRLDCWLSSEAFLALARLSRQQGESKRQVLERLILTADEANLVGSQSPSSANSSRTAWALSPVA